MRAESFAIPGRIRGSKAYDFQYGGSGKGCPGARAFVGRSANAVQPSRQEKPCARRRGSLQGLPYCCVWAQGHTSHVHGMPHLRWGRACRLRGARSRVALCSAYFHVSAPVVEGVFGRPSPGVLGVLAVTGGRVPIPWHGMHAMCSMLLEAPQTLSTSRCDFASSPVDRPLAFGALPKGKGG